MTDLERMARAMAKSINGTDDFWPELPTQTKQRYLDASVAALTALLPVDDAILLAMGNSGHIDGDPYAAMFTAALRHIAAQAKPAEGG